MEEQAIELPPMPQPAWREMRPLTVPKVAAEWFSVEQMQAYARAVVMVERERCAQIADDADMHERSDSDRVARGIAAAIRKG
jgi:hypothetical protein